MIRLICSNISISVEDQLIISDLSLIIEPGTTHVLMGSNGSGKSTFANALMGHPRYKITAGSVLLDDINITNVSPDKRARAGMFLAAQQHVSLPGVRVFTFVQEVKRAITGQAVEIDALYDELCEYLALLGLDESFASRDLYEGFSGGQKKRFELLQLLLFRPKIAILDEIDSGLDTEGRKLLTQVLEMVREQEPKTSILLISHYEEMIELLAVDKIHRMHQGKLICSKCTSNIPNGITGVQDRQYE